jgi:hypothetical protein
MTNDSRWKKNNAVIVSKLHGFDCERKNNNFTVQVHKKLHNGFVGRYALIILLLTLSNINEI